MRKLALRKDLNEVACSLFLCPFFSSLMVILLMIVVFSGDAYTEGFQLREKDCKVCQTFNASVTLGDCSMSVNATTPPFGTSAWVPMDLMASKDLIKKIENFMSFGDQFASTGFDNPKELEAWIKQLIEFDLGKVWTAELDIDNDGILDKVVKYQAGKCLQTTFWATALVVLDKSGASIDVAKSKPIIKGYQGTVYDILFYNGETFILAWVPYSDEIYLLRFKAGQMQQMN